MGKVIQYTPKSKKQGKGTPAGRSSRKAVAAQSEEGKGKPIDATPAWNDEDLGLHRKLLLELMNKEEYAQAQIVARHINELEPGDAYAWYLRGIALLEVSEPAQAEACFRKSMEIGETEAADCYQVARARLLLGDLEGAESWCERALEMDPKKPNFHWLLIRIHEIHGAVDMAISLCEKALPVMTETADKVRIRQKLADLNLASSAPIRAEKQLRAALKLNPENAQLWTTMGHCLSRQGRIEESLEAFEKAVEIDPQSPNHFYNIGDAYLSLGMSEKAVRPLLKAVQMNEEYRLAYYDLSLAYFNLKRYWESERAAKMALGDDQEMNVQGTNLGMGATLNMGIALMCQREMKQAEECFRRNLQQVESTYFNLGLVLFRTQRHEEALENFRRALDLSPEDPEYLNLLGQTYEALGKPEEAERTLRRAIEIDPEYAEGYYDIGVILSKREGRKKEAFAAFEKALKLDPDLQWACYCIASLHAVEGKEVPALKWLEKAFQKGFREFDHIDKDSDWEGFRKNPKFKQLLQKYRGLEKGQ